MDVLTAPRGTQGAVCSQVGSPRRRGLTSSSSRGQATSEHRRMTVS